MKESVINNKEKHRFELHVNGQIAFIAYRIETQINQLTLYVFEHTKVPKALEGKGIGSRLTAGALELVQAEGAKIRPECSFTSAYLARNPQYESIIAS